MVAVSHSGIGAKYQLSRFLWLCQLLSYLISRTTGHWKWDFYNLGNVKNVALLSIFSISVITCLLLVLATSMVISGLVPICDSEHSWWLYSTASLGHQAASTITFSDIPHYPDSEPTSPCPILIMQST